ncbi:hypothetical protein ACFWAO_38510, partial [Streptomyces sp. NPDC059981]
TQTIEGVTGDTVTGTITPPTFSLGTGSAATAKQTAAITAAMTASVGSLTAAGAPSSDEHDKCMAMKIGGSIVYGGAWGALSGPEGVAIGMLTGAFKGIAKGVVECRGR